MRGGEVLVRTCVRVRETGCAPKALCLCALGLCVYVCACLCVYVCMCVWVANVDGVCALMWRGGCTSWRRRKVRALHLRGRARRGVEPEVVGALGLCACVCACVRGARCGRRGGSLGRCWCPGRRQR